MTAESISDSRFTGFKPDPQASLRLFCFPYAGGGASIFHTWSRSLPREVQVCPVQLPGRENRLMDPPFTRLAPLVQKLAEVLVPYLNLPFAFFGHSMGALISFELARELRSRHGLNPVHLFVSAHRAPQTPDRARPIHQLPESAMVTELCRRYNGIPAVVLEEAELMRLFVPIMKADLAVIETYVYRVEEPLDCSISAFGGVEDCQVSQEELAAWREQTRGSFKFRMLPGNHFFLRDAKESLLQAVSSDLIDSVSKAFASPR